MKLKNIKIENYRFFKEEQEFDFTSKDNIPQNILLYGENGSGKTSLYNALKDFFFYYKNQSESKTKIKENKNIFCEPTDKPKIEITFENDTNIKFSETGFENEDLKIEIEQVSKSKLFLTYQDIYNLNNIFMGGVTENYIATSLKSNNYSLYYWESDGKAEIDFIIQKETEIVPIEVKSSIRTKSRSLDLYMNKFNPKYGIRISEKNFFKFNRTL